MSQRPQLLAADAAVANAVHDFQGADAAAVTADDGGGGEEADAIGALSPRVGPGAFVRGDVGHGVRAGVDVVGCGGLRPTGARTLVRLDLLGPASR